MTVRGAVLAALLYLVLPLTQAAAFLAVQPFADLPDVLNFGASIVAYHWLLANVLLGLKLPTLQRALPYDLRIRLHVWSTMGLVVFLAWHAVYTIFLKAKLIDVVSWSLLGIFTALVVLSLLWIPLPGMKTLRSKLLGLFRFGFLRSYDWLKAVHKVLFFVLAGLTYVHIVQAEIIPQVPELSGWGYQLLFLATAAAFIWTRIHNLTLPTLEVRSVAVAGGIVRLNLEPHPRLRYRSGQFAFLRFKHPDLKDEEHPFSFTSARGDDGVGFAIRALGDFTGRMTALKPGDKVRVNGGFGSFHPSRGRHPVALIGSGIGAAPLVSILKELSVREPDREVTALISVGTREELIDPQALEEIRAKMPNLTLKIYVYAEDGRLYGKDLFAAELGDPGRWDYYLCSSDKVRGIVVGALKDLGVKARRIHFEAFNLG